MINTNNSYNNMFNSVAREFVGRVELLEGSTLVQVFEHDGALQSFTIEKTGNNTRFFGYGICQKATVKLRDQDRTINIKKGQGLQIAHGLDVDYLYTYPLFYVDDISRNETTNELTITAYDVIYKASSRKVNELKLPTFYTLQMFIAACAGLIGVSINFENINEDLLKLEYTIGSANFSGSETIREALDDAAEMLGAIYYLNNDWELTFKSLAKRDAPVLAIDKSKYFELTLKSAHTLQNVVSATEIGDNVTASSGISGETEYLRDNAFLTLREDIGAILQKLLSVVAGLTLYQFDCKHRGDFRLELGDRISLTTKDDATITSYVLDDSLTYNGGLIGKTRLEYKAGEGVDSSTPATINDTLKQTFAKVDKVNNQITLLASESSALSNEVASLRLEADKIEASVETLDSKVSAAVTKDTVNFLIREELENGVTAVKTETGFTFNSDGMTINKSGTEMTTTITEDGMTINRGIDEVLVANHRGVQATDLQAKTFLIIGDLCRFEEYNTDGRVGCFWIGG